MERITAISVNKVPFSTLEDAKAYIETLNDQTIWVRVRCNYTVFVKSFDQDVAAIEWIDDQFTFEKMARLPAIPLRNEATKILGPQSHED